MLTFKRATKRIIPSCHYIVILAWCRASPAVVAVLTIVSMGVAVIPVVVCFDINAPISATSRSIHCDPRWWTGRWWPCICSPFIAFRSR